jgi:hypothetical protein
MRQQINLHQPLLLEEPKLFGAATALRGIAAVVVTLAMIWGYGSYKVKRLQQVAETLRLQQQGQEAALAAAGAFTASRSTPTDLAALVKRTEAEVAGRTRALELLRAGAAGRTTGFAARLEALAHGRVDGVWIDRMALSGSTDSMSLGGATLDPDLVPRYLHNLAQESVLAGARFDQLVIERPSEKGSDTAYIRFHAQSLVVPVAVAPEQDKGAT